MAGAESNFGYIGENQIIIAIQPVWTDDHRGGLGTHHHGTHPGDGPVVKLLRATPVDENTMFLYTGGVRCPRMIINRMTEPLCDVKRHKI